MLNMFMRVIALLLTSFTPLITASAADCVGTFYNVTLLDSYGDGWTGNIPLVIDSCENVELLNIELNDGYKGFAEFCVPSDGLNGDFIYSCRCLDVSCDYSSETGWIIYDVNGNQVLSGDGFTEESTYGTCNTRSPTSSPTPCPATVSSVLMLKDTDYVSATEAQNIYDILSGLCLAVDLVDNPWTSGTLDLTGYDVFVIPELGGTGVWPSTLSSSDITELYSFVSNGGSFIIIGNSNNKPYDAALLYDVFGYNITHLTNAQCATPSSVDVADSWDYRPVFALDSAPTSLSNEFLIHCLDVATLPDTAVSAFGTWNESWVTWIPLNLGAINYLAWDFYGVDDAEIDGTLDDWVKVLSLSMFSQETFAPTSVPTSLPTLVPTYSVVPSEAPTPSPSFLPSPAPTPFPSFEPTALPTLMPSPIPTSLPSSNPTSIPSILPSPSPTPLPTPLPTPVPTSKPSSVPTSQPSLVPTQPTFVPTPLPTAVPSFTPEPSMLPTSVPTPLPSLLPTPEPSMLPTLVPTPLPSLSPTPEPSILPTPVPTPLPSPSPTNFDQVSTVVSMAIGASSESDITQAVITSSLSTTLAGIGVSASNIKNFVYSSWTASRRLLGQSEVQEEEGVRRLSGVASVSVTVAMDLSTTAYTTAGQLQTAIATTLDDAQTDGSFVSTLSSDCGCTISSVSSSTTLAREYPTLLPTPAPTLLPTACSLEPFTVTRPRGGESYTTGDIIPVSWQLRDCTGSFVDIYICAYVSGGGSTCYGGVNSSYTNVANRGYEANNGNFSLRVTTDLPLGSGSGYFVKLVDDLDTSLTGKSADFTYFLSPTSIPTPVPYPSPTTSPVTPPPTGKENVHSASSNDLVVVGAGAAAGLLLLGIAGVCMARACRGSKDERSRGWTDAAQDALNSQNSVIEIGRMSESDVPETAVAVAGAWVEEGEDSEIPVAALVSEMSDEELARVAHGKGGNFTQKEKADAVRRLSMSQKKNSGKGSFGSFKKQPSSPMSADDDLGAAASESSSIELGDASEDFGTMMKDRTKLEQKKQETFKKNKKESPAKKPTKGSKKAQSGSRLNMTEDAYGNLSI